MDDEKVMRINPRLKSDISKVMVITIAFVLINVFFSFYNDSLITSGYVAGTTASYDQLTAWLINIISGVLAGLLGGSALVMVNGTYFRKKSFGYALRATFISYVIVYVVVLLVGSFFSVYTMLGSSITLKGYIDGFTFFAMSKMAMAFFIFWCVISLLTLFFLQINDKFGPGMFLKFLAGKYHQPKEEDRIFMFLDLKSSTTIAERIGNKQYFNLLNDLYSDITNSILTSEGQIYQYVGDEVVISWDLPRGLKKANCVKCFPRIKEKLYSRTVYYQKNYGVKPEFKAGLHHGEVTAGEIGGIKRDIVYSGDVLNTTSRIQEQCKNYQVDFIISNETLAALNDNLPYKSIPLGKITLRGKNKPMELNTLTFENELGLKS